MSQLDTIERCTSTTCILRVMCSRYQEAVLDRHRSDIQKQSIKYISHPQEGGCTQHITTNEQSHKH